MKIERYLPEMLEKAENDYLHDIDYAREQGVKQGAHQEALTNAKNLHALGVEKKTILRAIDITEEEFN